MLRTTSLVSTFVALTTILTVYGTTAESAETLRLSSALALLPKSEASIFLFGDPDHSKLSIRDSVGNSLSAFKIWDPDINCLFVEQDVRLQPAIDQYLNNSGASYSSTVAAKKSEISLINTVDLIPESLLNAARQASYKVFAVDINYDSPLGARNQSLVMMLQLGLSISNAELAEATVTNRNQEISDRINKLISSKTCSKAMLLLGSAHFSTEVRYVANQPAAKVTSIQLALSQTGMKTRIGGVVSLDCAKADLSIPGVATACELLEKNESLAAVQSFNPLDPLTPEIVLLAK